MRIIKLGIISIITLFLLATAISLLFPSKVVVSRAVDIKSFKQPVYSLVSDLRKWNLWVEGMNNPAVEVYSAVAAKLGTTMVTVNELTDSTIVSSWHTGNSSDQISTIRLIEDSSHKIIVVQWQFVQQVKWYPWEKFGSMMNDKIIGTMIEKNLYKLKQVAEQR
jgi:hypothetical protein